MLTYIYLFIGPMLQVAEDGSMSEREDNAQKKAAEASDLAKEAEADLAEAVSEN